MNWTALTSGQWLLHSALGGGLLLFLAALLMTRTKQPAKRQRLGEWAVVAALLFAVLSLGPRWLRVWVPADSLLPAEEIVQVSDPRPSFPPVMEVIDYVPQQQTLYIEPLTHSSPDATLAMNTPPASSTSRRGPNLEDQWAGVPVREERLPPPALYPLSPARPESEKQTATARPALVKTLTPESPLDEPAPAALAADSFRPADLASEGRRWLVSVYGITVAVLLATWLFGHLALWRLLRDARPAPFAVRRLFLSLVPGCQRPRLLMSDRFQTPVSCGLVRPTIVLPSTLCRRVHPSVLRWVFAHELAHLNRRDAWSSLLFALARAIYFYVPWFWWMRRQVRLCQEYVADAAAAHTGQPLDYAQFLVSLKGSRVLPNCATGVAAPTSDLFRRISMLLHNPTPLELRCSRPWSWATAFGLSALAVLVAGVGFVRAAPLADDDQKNAPKKDDNRPSRVIVLPDMDKIMGDVKFNFDAGKLHIKGLDEETEAKVRAQIEKAQKDLQKAQEQWKEKSPQGFEVWKDKFSQGFQFEFDGSDPKTWTYSVASSADGRLGVRLQKPSATLADQLNLPEGRGLVIMSVRNDSPAAKAGFKVNDILWELDGKPVPSNAREFTRMLDEVKVDKSIDAVVFRKGKNERVRGLTIPEAKKPEMRRTEKKESEEKKTEPKKPETKKPETKVPQGRVDVETTRRRPGQGSGSGSGSATALARSNDRFDIAHREGSVHITINGKVEDGKTRTTDIRVQDDDFNKRYERVEQVPEKYRDKVKSLLEMVDKSTIRVDTPKP